MKFSILLQYITPHRSVLMAVIALLLIGSAAALAQPWLAGQLVQALLASNDSLLGINEILGLWLALMILRSVLEFTTRYYVGSAGEAITANLRTRLFQHMQALPIAYHHQQRSGHTLALLSHDAQYISGFVTGTLVYVLPLLLVLTGAFLLMLNIDPVIACVAIVLLPAYFLAIKIVGRSIRPLSRSWMDAYSGFVSFLDESLDMRPAIKSFVREPVERQQFEQSNQRLMSLSKRQLFIQSLLSPTVTLLSGMGLLLLVMLGSSRIANGALNAADLTSLLFYAMLLSQPLKGLADTYGQIQLTRGAAQRIIAFLNELPEPDDSGNTALPPVKGDIRFNNVAYHYPGGNPVLQGLNLHIAAGDTVAITGANGAGKSTIAHLLMRMADTISGDILIDGHNIRDVSTASLRSQIGVVSQHTLLINGSVAENIAYGQPLVNQEKIERAARRAYAHDFISRLPSGYNTLIGDQGLRLSGGQRQRLSLARTLLLDPTILILDEATSMFDPAGEKQFIEECKTLLGGKTVILITHRPASLALAQDIIHLPCASDNAGPANT